MLDRFNVRKREAVGRGEEEVSGRERRKGERGGEGRRRERRREGKEEKGRGGEGKDKGNKPIKYMMSIGDTL